MKRLGILADLAQMRIEAGKTPSFMCCAKCGRDYFASVDDCMLTEKLWETICKNNKLNTKILLCCYCVEELLEREIVLDDLSGDMYYNFGFIYKHITNGKKYVKKTMKQYINSMKQKSLSD